MDADEVRGFEYDWDHDDKIRAEGADRENDLTQESRERRGGN